MNNHFFLMGWNRAQKRLNHATRRQFRKSKAESEEDSFALGFFLGKLFKLLKGAKS